MSENQSNLPSVPVDGILKLVYNQLIQFKIESKDNEYFQRTCGDVTNKVENMINLQSQFPTIAKELFDGQFAVRHLFTELNTTIDNIVGSDSYVIYLKRNFNTLYHLFALNNRALIQRTLSPVPFISIIHVIYSEFMRLKLAYIGPDDMYKGAFNDIKLRMETLLRLKSNFDQYLNPNAINETIVYGICDTLIDIISEVKLDYQKDKTSVTYLTNLGENITNLRMLTSSNKLD